MNATDFCAWVAHMKQTRGWSGRECSRRLGSGTNQVPVWKRRGAPAYIGLACTALDRNLPCWQAPEASGQTKERP